MAVKVWSWLALFFIGCAAPRAPESFSGLWLGSDGVQHPLLNENAEFTVLEFFSAHCPCQATHDARLRALAQRYVERGVAFVAVDSELGASLASDADEARNRGYPFPILVDAEGAAARALDAEYATYTLLVDRSGQVLFRGGIDSDRNHLRADATPYLQNAIEDALAGRPLRAPRAPALGCSLMLKPHFP